MSQDVNQPGWGINRDEGLNPKRPLKKDGMRMLPPISEPIPKGLYMAATAAPSPPLLPPNRTPRIIRVHGQTMHIVFLTEEGALHPKGQTTNKNLSSHPGGYAAQEAAPSTALPVGPRASVQEHPSTSSAVAAWATTF